MYTGDVGIKVLYVGGLLSLFSDGLHSLSTHAYLDAVQQFAHAPEAVSLNVPQSLFLKTGHVKVLYFLLWRRETRTQRDCEK